MGRVHVELWLWLPTLTPGRQCSGQRATLGGVMEGPDVFDTPQVSKGQMCLPSHMFHESLGGLAHGKGHLLEGARHEDLFGC